MSKKPASRYSLTASYAYIAQWLIITLVIYLILFVIAYLMIVPIFETNPNKELYNKILWSVFAIVSFLSFAVVFIITNSQKYWIDLEYIQFWNVYRPSKKRQIEFKDINDLKIRRMPITSTAFNFGTIVLFSIDKNGKRKRRGSLRGIKFVDDVYLELIQKINLPEEDIGKKLREGLPL
ncbi:MAG: hypothetical protein FK734_03985 [Asgard group archaeon]|nr:hypothetical protein [Asgard group archaeon]